LRDRSPERIVTKTQNLRQPSNLSRVAAHLIAWERRCGFNRLVRERDGNSGGYAVDATTHRGWQKGAVRLGMRAVFGAREARTEIRKHKQIPTNFACLLAAMSVAMSPLRQFLLCSNIDHSRAWRSIRSSTPLRFHCLRPLLSLSRKHRHPIAMVAAVGAPWGNRNE